MKFNLLYVDFPWMFNSRDNKHTKFGTGMHKYPGMSIDQIKAIDLDSIAGKDCAIAAWATGAKMEEFFLWQQHMKNFGFRYASKIFSWVKVAKDGTPRALPGFYSLSNTEDCFLLVRGRVANC